MMDYLKARNLWGEITFPTLAIAVGLSVEKVFPRP